MKKKKAKLLTFTFMMQEVTWKFYSVPDFVTWDEKWKH